MTIEHLIQDYLALIAEQAHQEWWEIVDHFVFDMPIDIPFPQECPVICSPGRCCLNY